MSAGQRRRQIEVKGGNLTGAGWRAVQAKLEADLRAAETIVTRGGTADRVNGIAQNR